MKIAVFVSYLPPHIGGIEVVAANQIKALSEAGHVVRVVTSACGTTPGLEITSNDSRIWYIPAWNYAEDKLGAAFPIFSPSLFIRAYKVVKEADVVHVHDAFYMTSLAAAFWARVLRKPLILTQHVDEVPHPKLAVRFVQRVVYVTTGKFILNSSARIIVLNSRVKKFLIDKKIDEKKVIFLPNGLDTDLFAPANKKVKKDIRKKYDLPSDKTLALFVGRFVPKKGFTKLMNLEEIENLDLVFAGGYAPEKHHRKDHHFLGPVNHNDIPDIFKACDIFVLPSEGEGFPVTIQEAMASGLAIITSNDPAYDLYKLNEEHIKLVKPTARNISKSLSEMTLDHSKQNAAKSYLREYAVNNFSLSTNSDRLVDIYTEVYAGVTASSAVLESEL